MAKPPKTIPDQIALLQNRNLSFRNVADAPHFLSNISYYRLQGYWWEMQDDKINHHFANGSFFEDALDLYNFDRHFRLIVFNAIERLEIALRTKLIYHLSLTYGPHWYIDPSLFDSQVSQLQSKIDYCENRVNELVYLLYELTPEEIKIVEGG